MKVLQEQLPADWLEQHRETYLELAERLTIANIRLKAVELKWDQPFDKPEDYLKFFEAEAKRLDFSVDQIKGFFHQAAQNKAKEQIFEKNFGDLVPRNSEGKSLLDRNQLLELVHAGKIKPTA